MLASILRSTAVDYYMATHYDVTCCAIRGSYVLDTKVCEMLSPGYITVPCNKIQSGYNVNTHNTAACNQTYKQNTSLPLEEAGAVSQLSLAHHH